MIQAIKGTKDLFGNELLQWLNVENTIREICRYYNVGEIITPIFENTELFVKGTGDTTDVVQKEMYTFTDKGDRSITLKPEGTTPVVRAFIEHNLYANVQPTKIFYLTPCFRYEQPQAGRMRQFHQFGIEYLGTYSASADAEVISVALEVFNRIGIKNVKLYINSIGTPVTRKIFNEELKEFAQQNLDALCGDCVSRFKNNPLRLLDCKNEKCKQVMANAPSILDSLDDDCKEHFEKLQKILKYNNIDFEINDKIVRGLDYYTKTVFEFVCEGIGAQNVICGGGRYDYLIESIGGPKTGAIGFAMGLERIMLAIEKQNLTKELENKVNIFVGSIGDKGFLESQKIVYTLRQKNICAETDNLDRSVKAQLKYANKIGAAFACIIGDDEVANGKVNLKNMETGEQTEIEISKLYDYIK